MPAPTRRLTRAARNQRYPAPVPPDRSELDETVHQLVRDALAPYGDVADVNQVWSDGGGMWFTQVTPKHKGAAPIVIAAEDATTLNVTIGNTWFEMLGPVPKNLPRLREIVEGVLAGRMEEAGSKAGSYARIHGSSRTVSVGHMHLPWPWRLRRARRYAPYGEA